MKNNIVKIDIAQAIQIHNDRLGLSDLKKELTAQDIVDKMDGEITMATIRNWKKGKVPKAFLKIVEILHITGCNLDDILYMQHGEKTIF